MRVPPEAIRIARAGLGWTQRDLAQRAGVSCEAVKRAERYPLANLTVASMDAIERTLLAAGVTIEDSFENGLSVGIIGRYSRGDGR